MDQPSSPFSGQPSTPPVSPLSAPPIPRFADSVLPSFASDDAVCLQCGYQIRGIASDRSCPECGTPISRSMRGNLLIFSASGYLRSLHIGLICILLASILQAVFGILSAFGGVAVVLLMVGSGAGGQPGAINQAMVSNLQIWAAAAAMPMSALSLAGWWLFSAPDPAIRYGEQGQASRLTIRITVIIVALASVLSFAFIAMARHDPALIILASAAGILSGIASLVQFFASMLYVRWLAPRIPDIELVSRAVLYMWLLPLIYVVGSCVIVGPLVAQIMYLLLLNRIRVRLRIIRERQAQDFPQTAT